MPAGVALSGAVGEKQAEAQDRGPITTVEGKEGVPLPPLTCVSVKQWSSDLTQDKGKDEGVENREMEGSGKERGAQIYLTLFYLICGHLVRQEIYPTFS